MQASAPSSSRAVLVRSTPHGQVQASDFEVAEAPLPELADGDVRIRVDVLSLDPYLRSLLGPGHLGEPAVGPGAVMPGRAIGTVTLSRHPDVPEGSQVLAETGWRTEAVVAGDATTPVSVPAGVPASAVLGVLGMPGLTAFAVVERHLRPAAGETIVVTAATGGVGSLVGQLARLAGARTVAIVGDEDKAAIAKALGYDATVLRGRPGWIEELHAACPEKIHGYVHMADQETLDGVVEHLAVGARVSLVGVIDQNNGAAPTRIRVGALMAARATTYGMVVYDHADLADAHRERVGELLARGEVVALEDAHEGLENAGHAFAELMAGRNRGKVVVHVS
ncbi:NADP-dependent oxidoreductase [Nocardioides sp. zg-ZUI104]|uniref:MDR family NADP-dependent oxidoreductase n=1 Tax=Nocardioides faecalis TaxID=2803858 RepID=UPI001BCE5744|nr:NADP-dependent oxidoreductase [Nocardioides faecalis]MBS4751402.1 NADP-dependent oxidoreductase [Nocardioides faecalis]